MAKRKGAVLVECSRCPRTEYLPEEEADSIGFNGRLGNEPAVVFADLCKGCQGVIKAALENIAKPVTKASRGKKEDEGNE